MRHLRTSFLRLIVLGVIASMPIVWGCAARSGIAIPQGVELSVLLAPEKKKMAPLPPTVPFDIDSDGNPFFAARNTLVGLNSLNPLQILDVPAIDDFAWMRDGTLVLLTRGSIAEIGPYGSIEMGPSLPGTGMRIRPAASSTAYIFGGRTEPANRTVYLFASGGKVANLLTLPSPVTAVAGDGETTYVAAGTTVVRIASNEPASVVFEAPAPIISLEFAPDEKGFFYSTKSSVGHVAGDGAFYEFLRGKGGQLRLSGSSLFLLVPEAPYLFRFHPVDRF